MISNEINRPNNFPHNLEIECTAAEGWNAFSQLVDEINSELKLKRDRFEGYPDEQKPESFLNLESISTDLKLCIKMLNENTNADGEIILSAVGKEDVDLIEKVVNFYINNFSPLSIDEGEDFDDGYEESREESIDDGFEENDGEDLDSFDKELGDKIENEELKLIGKALHLVTILRKTL